MTKPDTQSFQERVAEITAKRDALAKDPEFINKIYQEQVKARLVMEYIGQDKFDVTKLAGLQHGEQTNKDMGLLPRQLPGIAAPGNLEIG